MPNEVKICTFDEVEAEDVSWLWKPYIAYGKLTVIQGDPGNGKTTLALAIAALVSRRQHMPTGGAKPVIGNVIYQSGEDSPKDTIKPRLVACDADCSKIAFVESDGALNIKMFEEAIIGTNAKLAVIDPLQAFLSANQDITRAKNMRPFLRDLGNVAERTGAAIVIIGHMNKSEKTKGIYRGLGSIDITAAARSVLLIGKSKNNENIRFMAQIKNNLSAFGKAVSFTVNQRGGVEFLGECDITEEELLSSAGERQTKYQIARELITAMLSDGDKRSNEIFDACLKAGVTSNIMTYVKRDLGIKSERKLDDWYWTLNPEAEDDSDEDMLNGTLSDINEPPDVDSDETPVMFLDEITAMEQLPVMVKSLLPKGKHQRNSVKFSPSDKTGVITKMDSPFGELELLDWRACV